MVNSHGPTTASGYGNPVMGNYMSPEGIVGLSQILFEQNTHTLFSRERETFIFFFETYSLIPSQEEM